MATNNNELKLATGATVANQTVNGNVVGLDVNLYSSWNINQTTAGITLTLNNPARPTVDVGLVQLITNIGTVPFTMYGAQVNPNQTVMVKYAGTVWTAITAPPATNSPITDWALIGNAGTNPANNYIGTSDAQNISIRTNGVERIVVDTAGRVGAGVATPVNRFDVYQPSTDASFSYAATSDGASIPFFSFLGNATATKNTVLARASRGTTALPTGTLLNDYTRFLTYSNHNGTGFSTSAHFGVAHTENSAAASNGNQFNFFATPVGAAAAVRSATLLGGGFLGLGASTPHSGITNPASFATGFLNSNAAALTLDGTHNNIVLTLAGAQTVTLPATTGIITRVYTIANPTTTIKTISNYTDITGVVSTVIPANSSLTIQADSTVWRQINGGGATAPTIQQLNATGNVTAWNSTVEIGVTPLTANITVTLPTTVGNIGKAITFIRRDNTAFTVTLVGQAGQTVTLKNLGTELSQQNGALTIQAIDATNTRQTSNIGVAPVVAEFGSVTLNNQVFATNTPTNSTNGIYNIPSAGTWRLRYDVISDGTGAPSPTVQFRIADSANAVVAGSEKTRGGAVTAAVATSGEVFVTTTGATTYTLQAANGGTGSVTILNAATAKSTISWEKVGGQVAVSGQSVDYKAVNTWNVSAIAALTDVNYSSIGAGNIPYSAGLFTLKAGVTYELKAHIEGTLTGNTGTDWVQFRFVDAANNPLPNSPVAVILGTANTSAWQNSAGLNTIYTPTVDTQVKLRLVNRGGTSSFSSNGGLQSGSGNWMTVTQLGTSAIAAPLQEIAQFIALDTPVTIDNLRIEARITGGQGFRVGTVTGTMLANISGVCSFATASVFGSNVAGTTLTTTMTHPFAWTGQSDADGMTGQIFDRTNNRMYEFTIMTNVAPTLSYIRIKRTI